MGDTSARDLLAEELRNLKASAVLSLAQIEEQGNKQKPRAVKLGKAKLSGWLKGVSVPEADAPFHFLIQLLEPRASRSGVPAKGIHWWLDLRQKAADERSAAKASKPAGSRGQSASAPAPVPTAPSASDMGKAARLLRLLPQDGHWYRWLTDAETMFRVPLTVSDPVCDAHRPLETDLPDYVDPDLQDGHRDLVAALGTLCFELNGMTDISDEGPDILEINHPGTSAERNALNRQACQARDQFIPAYTRMINLLNVKGLLPPTPKDPLDIAVSLLAARWVPGGALAAPLTLAAKLPSTDPAAPYYFVVEATSLNDQAPQIAAASIEIIQPNGDAALTHLFPARGPGHRLQLPFQLSAYGAGQAVLNASEVAVAIRMLGDAAAQVRAFIRTGNGRVFPGPSVPVEDMKPFLDVVLAPADS
ncbi:hypothetical protein PUR34_24670 [Streptomyces sp. JV185]|uniref:hypothetical protein n=1 Tax=Streptomyces sp. JV185 TaxID=858638 RepID=UPI002E796A84|nr:hypothetical protein [Streptomyces sp. JV185]MEE1771245.1 hypothetical protein [Streptomyces sp. JV185]